MTFLPMKAQTIALLRNISCNLFQSFYWFYLKEVIFITAVCCRVLRQSSVQTALLHKVAQPHRTVMLSTGDGLARLTKRRGTPGETRYLFKDRGLRRSRLVRLLLLPTHYEGGGGM